MFSSNFFHFLQFWTKILSNNRFSPQTEDLVPPSGKSLIRHGYWWLVRVNFVVPFGFLPSKF